MRDLTVMQVEKVWGAVVRFQHGQVLGSKVLIPLLAGQDREEETQDRRSCVLRRYSRRRLKA